MQISLHNMLTFLEFLAQQNFSPKVIRNYMSSAVTMARFYHLQHVDTLHVLIVRFLRSLSMNSTFAPTPKGIFYIPERVEQTTCQQSLNSLKWIVSHRQKRKKMRKFNSDWLSHAEFSKWLQYEQSTDKMFCIFCKKAKQTNVFTKGCGDFQVCNCNLLLVLNKLLMK